MAVGFVGEDASGVVAEIFDAVAVLIDEFQLDPVFARFEACEVGGLPTIEEEALTVDGGSDFPVLDAVAVVFLGD